MSRFLEGYSTKARCDLESRPNNGFPFPTEEGALRHPTVFSYVFKRLVAKHTKARDEERGGKTAYKLFFPVKQNQKLVCLPAVMAVFLGLCFLKVVKPRFSSFYSSEKRGPEKSVQILQSPQMDKVTMTATRGKKGGRESEDGEEETRRAIPVKIAAFPREGPSEQRALILTTTAFGGLFS